MKKYIEKIKSNKKALYISIAIMLLFVGASFAYVVAQLSGGAQGLFNINADTTDQLLLDVDKEISLKATQFNFQEGAGDLSDQAIATARLKANSTKNTATYNYYVYLDIEENTYKYTTSDKKTEILLQVTDPNGTSITSLGDLKYDNTLNGFDITEYSGLIPIAENYEITSSSSKDYTIQDWTIKVTFINLDTNQKENGGKTINGKVMIQRNELRIVNLSMIASNIPSTSGALANLNCTGATSNYNQQYNRIEVSQGNNKAECILNYTNISSKTYLNNKIIGLSGTTQGEGQVVNEKGYRYEGQNPNNWVWFNNELWRIIGVFDSSSHGISNTNLVKIIRNKSIGGLVWDKSKVNNWSTASLKSLLNNEYLNSTNGTNGENCYVYDTTIKAKCDYSLKGIKEEYRKMIKEVTWYLGGYSNSNITTDSMYSYERSSTKYDSNPTSINAKVGLMYASDYGYAVPSANCARASYNLSNYNYYSDIDANLNCSLYNWLYGEGIEWMLTPNSSNSSDAFSLNNDNGYYGNVSYIGYNTKNGYGVRPTLYLDDSVYVIGGTGSEADPYIIRM